MKDTPTRHLTQKKNAEDLNCFWVYKSTANPNKKNKAKEGKKCKGCR